MLEFALVSPACLVLSVPVVCIAKFQCAAGCRWTCPVETFDPFADLREAKVPFRIPARLRVAALQIDHNLAYDTDQPNPFHLDALHRSEFAQILTRLRIAAGHPDGPHPWDIIDVTDQAFHRLEVLNIYIYSVKGTSLVRMRSARRFPYLVVDDNVSH